MGLSDNFYQQLQPLNKFTHLAQDAYYQELPDDWSVIIADISGSTQAIEVIAVCDV